MTKRFGVLCCKILQDCKKYIQEVSSLIEVGPSDNKVIFKTGMTAVEVIIEIVKQHLDIDALAFYAYKPKQNVCEMKEIPFADQLLFHDSATGRERWLKREEITQDNLFKMTRDLQEGYVLGVMSKVVLKRKETLHVPMMDFSEGRSPEQSQNLAEIVYFLQRAGYSNGIILFSGRSFHYYGNYLMSERAWRGFLGDCLLYGLADPRYVGHREKDGYGALRISACPLRPHIPKVVSVLD